MPEAAAEWWTLADIARYWDVQLKTVYWYRYRSTHGYPGTFPKPDAVIGRTPVWRPTTVKNFERPGKTPPGTNTRALAQSGTPRR